MVFEKSHFVSHLVLTIIFSTLPCSFCPAIILELLAHRSDQGGRKAQFTSPLLITCIQYRTTNAGQCRQRRKDYFICLYPMFRFCVSANRLVECGSGRRTDPQGTVYLDHQTIETLFTLMETSCAYRINSWNVYKGVNCHYL